MPVTAPTSTVVATRSTRRYAEKYVADWADVQGEQTRWDGQRSHPIYVVWSIERTPLGKFDIIQTVTPRGTDA